VLSSKIPCNNTSALVRLLAAPPKPDSHRSITSVVTSSRAIDPNAGSSCERTSTL
jgi:hypothetical protein